MTSRTCSLHGQVICHCDSKNFYLGLTMYIRQRWWEQRRYRWLVPFEVTIETNEIILKNLRKNPSDNADLSFQAVDLGLHIMQLNVEGLSAAKRHITESLAEIHHTDVICLQEIHVNDDKSNCLTISGFDIISYTVHTPCQTWTCDICSQRRLWCCACVVVSMLRCHLCGLNSSIWHCLAHWSSLQTE